MQLDKSKSHPCEILQNFKTQVSNGTESNGLNPFSRMTKIVKVLGYLFITSSRYHFFNETGLEYCSISLIDRFLPPECLSFGFHLSVFRRTLV